MCQLSRSVQPYAKVDSSFRYPNFTSDVSSLLIYQGITGIHTYNLYLTIYTIYVFCYVFVSTLTLALF